VAVALRLDPYLNFRFLVEIQGLIVAGFSEVNGLQAEIETFEYREGGLNDYAHRLPGPVR
jgi:phage tail-like protein